MKLLRVGIFHPTLNTCGGAEWVAFKIMDIMRKNNHKVTVLTNEKIDIEKIRRLSLSDFNFDSFLQQRSFV